MKVLKALGTFFVYFILMFIGLLALFLFLFGIPFLTMGAPTITGIAGGIIVAVGFALWQTTDKVHNSNHLGDEEMKYSHYAGESLKIKINNEQS